MKQFFLKISHWKLFILMVIIPFISAMLLSAEIELPGFYMNAMIFPILFFFFVYFSWMWSIGTVLSRKIPSGLTFFHPKKFKFSLIIPLILFITLPLLFILLFPYSLGNPAFRYLPLLSPIANILMFFCLLYAINQNAKIIKSIELNQKAGLADFIGEFFSFFFFPLGIWELQPKINEYSQLPDTNDNPPDLTDHLINQ